MSDASLPHCRTCGRVEYDCLCGTRGWSPAVRPRADAIRLPLPPTRTDTPLAGMLNELLAGQLTAGDAILDWLEDFRVLPRRAAQYQRFEEALGALVAHLRTIEAESLALPDWKRRARVTVAWERLREDAVAIFAFDLWGRGEILGWAAGVMGEGRGA